MSSIFSIILTSCVARLICCFFANSVSITCCDFMSVEREREREREGKREKEREREEGRNSN